MMRRLLDLPRSWFLLLGGAVLLFGGGLLAGDVSHDDPEPVLAVAGAPLEVRPVELPVLDETGTPVSLGAIDPGDGDRPGSSAAATGATFAPVGRATPGAALLDALREAAVAPAATTSSANGDEPATEGDAESVDGDGGALGIAREATGSEGLGDRDPVDNLEDLTGSDDGYFRFVDPCAGPAPGEPAEEPCPEGTAGVVLVGDGDVPATPSVVIDDPWMDAPYMPGSTERCENGVDAGGDIHATIYTNVPAVLEVTLDVRGEHHEVRVETSEAERSRFTRRLLAGEPIDGYQVNAVQNCLTFTSVPRSLRVDHRVAGAIYWYEPAVTATDDLGNEISYEPGYLQMRVVDADDALDEHADDVVARDDGAALDAELELGGVYLRPIPHTSARCDLGATADDALAGVLTSSLPGTFELAVIDRGRSIPVGTIETSAAERRIASEMRAMHEPPTAWGTAAVQNCFELTALGNPGSYYLDVTGTADNGSAVSKRLPFTISEHLAAGLPSVTAGRPPAIVVDEGDRATVLLSIDDDEETVRVRALPRTGPNATGESCTGIEASALRRGSSQGPAVDTSLPLVPRGLLGFTDRGYDERFDMMQIVTVFAGEGDVFDLCTWITTQERDDFDPTVEERRSFRLEAPRHLRARIDLTKIVSYRDNAPDDERTETEAGRYRIEAVNWPGSPSRSFPPEPTRGFAYFAADCDALGRYGQGDQCVEPGLTVLDSGAEPHPDVTHLRITDQHGRAVDVMVETPNSCTRSTGDHPGSCSVGAAHTFSSALPDNEGWACIDGCEGRRLVEGRAYSYAGPAGPPIGRGAANWVTRDEGSFDRATFELPRVPRADLTLDTPRATSAEPGARPTISLEIPFDRPVDVSVVPDIVSAVPDSCALPVEQRSTATAQRHVFTFTDTCFATTYEFSVVATDPVTGGSLHLPGPAFTVTTPGLPVASIDVELRVAGDQPMVRETLAATVRLDGHELVMAGPRDGCTAARGAVDVDARVDARAGSPRTIGELAELDIDLRWRTCDEDRRVVRIETGRPLRLPELLAGPVTYAAAGDGVDFVVTLTVAMPPDQPAPPLIDVTAP